MNDSTTLALFDLDKTLVRRDSFRLFANLGTTNPVKKLWFLGLAVLAKLRVISNRRYKELILDGVWMKRDKAERAGLVAAQVSRMNAMRIDPAVAALQGHLDAGDTVFIVTASPDIYVDAFAAQLDERIGVLASSLRPGLPRASVKNLYGVDKAQAAAHLADDNPEAHIHAYTDHHHDLPLLQLAHQVTLVAPDPKSVQAIKEAGIDPAILEAG